MLRVRKIWKYDYCLENTAQGNDFELILTVKMETRRHVEGSFSCEFPAICNHCRVMAAWSRKMLKYCEKFSKLCSETFHCLADRRLVFKFREIWRTWSRWNCGLLTWQKTKFRLPLQLSVLRGSRPKSARPAADNVIRELNILSKSVHVRQSYSRTREHCQNAP